MSFEYLQIIIPLLGLILNVVTHITSKRLVSNLGIAASMCAGFIAGFFGILIFEAFFSIYMRGPVKELISIAIVNIICYSSLGFLYYNFVGLGISALRTRTLIEINKAVGGITIEKCIECYSPEEILARRTKRLINSGQIVLTDGRYYICKSYLFVVAKIIKVMRLIVFGNKKINL